MSDHVDPSEYDEFDDYEKFRTYVRSFRLSQLQTFLAFSGQSRSGRKEDLQNKALSLVNLGSKTVFLKIKEIASENSRREISVRYGNSNSTDGKVSASNMASSRSYSNPCTSPIQDKPLASSRGTLSPLLHVLPTFPDVELRSLPFYDIHCVLLKPCSLRPSCNARFQEQDFNFHLTPTQASDITSSSYRNDVGRIEYRKQIQMRFSLLETSCQQEDNFPQSISVKVNGRLCPLPPVIPTNKPGEDPRRPPKPINITSLCKLVATSPNTVTISWAVEVGKSHTISIYYVQCLNYQDLINRLKEKGEKHPDFTKALIKEKLKDQDQEIATTSCKVSLACPLGKMRMRIPCRSTTCDHLQTFDAANFLQMNEKKPKWMCPVCNKPAQHQNLMIDGFFMELVQSDRLPPDEHEIVLHNDGTWDPLQSINPVKPDGASNCTDTGASKGQQQITDCVPIDSDSDSGGGSGSTVNVTQAVPPAPSNPAKRTLPRSSTECITLDSDSDDESDNKRHCPILSSANGVASTAPNQPPGSPELICLD